MNHAKFHVLLAIMGLPKSPRKMGAGQIEGCYGEKLQMTSEVTIRLKLCVCLFLATASFAAAQSSLVAPGTAYTTLPSPGSGHDYIQGLSEAVDPSTGGLTIQLPIPMPPGRGLTLPFSILLNEGGGAPVGGPTMYSNISGSTAVGGNLSAGRGCIPCPWRDTRKCPR